MNERDYSDNLLDERHKQIMESLNEIESQQETVMNRVRWTEKMIYMAMGAIGVLSIETFTNILKTFFG